MALSNVTAKDASGNAKKISTNLHTTDENAQVMQIGFGVEGSAPTLASSSNPLPVTASLGATDNAVLDAIQAAVEVIDNMIAGSEAQVDVVAALPAGTNNIGDVDIASIAAGTNLIGKMACGGNDEYYSGATALTVKWATVAASTSGNNTIVAAVSGKKIRVLQAELVANGTVNVKWQSGASGTDKTGLAYMVVNSGYVLPYSPIGWFETAASTLLNLNLSAAIAVGGVIAYVEV